MRNHLKESKLGKDTVFIARGTESTRLEQLSDAVIALAITLLLVSLETPKTGDELLLFAQDFLAFAFSTIVLITIWYMHALFFLRYGLRDKTIVVINSWLLIVVLFFVYPLKFIINFLLQYFKFAFLMLFNIEYDQQAFTQLITEVSSWEKLPSIMLIYSAGYMALVLSFALFYRHAFRKKEALALSPEEVQKTTWNMGIYFIQAIVAVLSMLIAFTAMFVPVPWFSILAGIIYFLIGPLIFCYEKRQSKKKLKWQTQTDSNPS